MAKGCSDGGLVIGNTPVNVVSSPSCSENQFEMIWAFIPAVLSCWEQPLEDRSTVFTKGWTILRYDQNDAHWVKMADGVPKIYPPRYYITGNSLNHCCLHQILTRPSKCHGRDRDSSDQTTFSNLVMSKFGDYVNCSLSFLFFADRSGTRGGLLLRNAFCISCL